MTDSIISRDTIRARARAAFERGAGRDDHKMNPGAPALEDWLDEYDLCAQAWHASLAKQSNHFTDVSEMVGELEVSPP